MLSCINPILLWSFMGVTEANSSCNKVNVYVVSSVVGHYNVTTHLMSNLCGRFGELVYHASPGQSVHEGVCKSLAKECGQGGE